MSEIKSMMGKCEYCGAEIGVMAKSQAEANKMASEKCDCSSARTAQKKRMLAEKLEELAGKKCEKLGFRPVDDDIRKLFDRIGEMVIDGRIQNAAFKVDGTVLNIKGGAKVKISRKYIHEQAEEIE